MNQKTEVLSLGLFIYTYCFYNFGRTMDCCFWYFPFLSA